VPPDFGALSWIDEAVAGAAVEIAATTIAESTDLIIE
jgi:hypothetical protein